MNSPRFFYYSNKAYTLIEILVSLTIVGLLFSVGYAGFRDFSRRQQVISSSRIISSELRLIQSKALSGEKPDSINCNDPNTLDSYSFEAIDDNSFRISANCSAGDVLIKNEDLPQGITFSSTQGTISFKVIGQGNNIPEATSVTITVTQTATGYSQDLTVTPGGEIK